MKKLCVLLAALLLICTLAGCGGKDAPETDTKESGTQTDTEETVPGDSETESDDATEAETSPDGGRVLVVVFSITGNTMKVAERIAAIENADTYLITAEVPYTEEDLDYNREGNRSKNEQSDKSARPGIAGELPDISSYDRIYIGFPIWHGEEPRIMDTFVENYDFGDKVMIPFCTSSASGIGQSGENLAELAGSGDWKTGKRFPEEGASDDELREWIESLE
ncbi:MAG: flavodoxin [Lachnospiraceae bacterium]|nr:flavodoxin [Lachnospiraceae bacterium]